MDSEDLRESIAKLQEEYYLNNQKNHFFKKSQKNDCATLVASNIDKYTLFNKTLFIIPEKNAIFFDYTVLKTYMSPELYDDFLQYEFNQTHEWVSNIESYELHINIKSLSISAYERYRGLIEKILNRYPPICPSNVKMSKLHVYYTPNIIQQILHILSPFIHHLKEKIVFYSKEESPEYVVGLLSS